MFARGRFWGLTQANILLQANCFRWTHFRNFVTLSGALVHRLHINLLAIVLKVHTPGFSRFVWVRSVSRARPFRCVRFDSPESPYDSGVSFRSRFLAKARFVSIRFDGALGAAGRLLRSLGAPSPPPLPTFPGPPFQPSLSPSSVQPLGACLAALLKQLVSRSLSS